MRVQKCTEVNGDQIADFRSSLGGRLICEVDLQASIYGMLQLLCSPLHLRIHFSDDDDDDDDNDDDDDDDDDEDG